MLSDRRKPDNSLVHQRCAPPDFTDPHTTLMAQRVIPLQETNGKRTLRGWGLVSGGFGLSLFLGATSGLVLGHFEFKAANTMQVDDPIATYADHTNYASLPDDPTTQSTQLLPATEEVTLKPSAPKRISKVQPVTRVANHSSGFGETDEEGQLKRIRDELLLDVTQRRRARIQQRHQPQ